jgi:uncharacterized protein (TIGR04141 family)
MDGEVTLDNDLYVLTGGDWFRINVDFKQRVYDYIDALDRHPGLPPADADTDEDHYNLKAADGVGRRLPGQEARLRWRA